MQHAWRTFGAYGRRVFVGLKHPLIYTASQTCSFQIEDTCEMCGESYDWSTFGWLGACRLGTPILSSDISCKLYSGAKGNTFKTSPRSKFATQSKLIGFGRRREICFNHERQRGQTRDSYHRKWRSNFSFNLRYASNWVEQVVQ